MKIFFVIQICAHPFCLRISKGNAENPLRKIAQKIYRNLQNFQIFRLTLQKNDGRGFLCTNSALTTILLL